MTKTQVENLLITHKLYEIIEKAYEEMHGEGILVVTSMYRNKNKNAAVGGSTKSQHLSGKAIDIAIIDGEISSLEDTITRLISTGAIPQGGLGLYDDHIHYDWRGTRERWDKRLTVQHQSITVN